MQCITCEKKENYFLSPSMVPFDLQRFNQDNLQRAIIWAMLLQKDMCTDKNFVILEDKQRTI